MKAQIIHQAFEKDARAVLRVVRKKFPEARIASGCPADVKGLSDVDILVFREGAKERRLLQHLEGREVNILITGDESRKRSLIHRTVELRLMRQDQDDLQRAVELKRLGFNSEAAWAKAMGPAWEWGMDPYDTLVRAFELGLHKGENDRDLLSPEPEHMPNPNNKMFGRLVTA